MICWEVLVTYRGASLVCSLLEMVTCWEVYWWLWPARKSLVMCDLLGKILLFLHGLLGNLCWFYSWGGPVCFMGKFLHNLRGGCLHASNLWGSHSMILYFTRVLVDDLNSRGSSLGDFWSIEGCFWCLQSIGDALCLLPNWGCFCNFGCILEFSFALPTSWEPTVDIWKLFFYFLFLLNYT